MLVDVHSCLIFNLKPECKLFTDHDERSNFTGMALIQVLELLLLVLT